MDFVKALDIAQGVFDQYKTDQRKWWSRMDGTPILNDVAVRMAQAFASLPSPPLSGEAWALSEDQYNGVREMIRQAFIQGCMDVNENYHDDVDPDFSEAAYDYTTSVTDSFINLFPSVRPSPLTNEPVGVTISCEHGHKIHEMLKYYFEKHVTDNDEAAALVALSAAIGERN